MVMLHETFLGSFQPVLDTCQQYMLCFQSFIHRSKCIHANRTHILHNYSGKQLFKRKVALLVPCAKLRVQLITLHAPSKVHKALIQFL